MFFFSVQKISYRRIGYTLIVMRQSIGLVFNPIMVDTMLLSLITHRWVGRQTL